jgi:uncharacterized membrane protein YcaP (DUF421 family)
MWQLGTPPLELVGRTAIVYVLFFGALRLFGKREIGQFTIPDLALVLIAANALQPAVTGPDQSIPGAVIIVLTIFVLNRLVSELRVRNTFVRRLLDFGPTVIGRDGHWHLRVLVREGLDLADVDAALREHGLDNVADMKVATLEEDGSISIVAKDSEANRTRRRRRTSHRQM